MAATYKITQVITGKRKFSCLVEFNGGTAESYEIQIPKNTVNPGQFIDAELMNEANKQLLAGNAASNDVSLVSSVTVDVNGKVVI